MRSDVLKKGPSRAPSRAMLEGASLKMADLRMADLRMADLRMGGLKMHETLGQSHG